MINALVTFRAYLLAQSTITDVVGTRIYADSVPPSVTDAWNLPENVTRTIYLAANSISVMGSMPALDAEIEVWCFGPTSDAANTLAGVVSAAINDTDRAVAGNVVIRNIQRQSGPTPQQIEGDMWNYAQSVYQASMFSLS